MNKLLGRIVAPSDLDEIVRDDSKQGQTREENLTLVRELTKGVYAYSIFYAFDSPTASRDFFVQHDHTYGITSDPLTQFALLLSALIHDVDHTGVPNTQVLAENQGMAQMYGQRSVAEQNSLDLSWDLFMDDRYSTLRSALFETRQDLIRFRQLVVNSVMATDIADKELKTLRNARWDKAFQKADGFVKSELDGFNRKATIVIEHVIQAVGAKYLLNVFFVSIQSCLEITLNSLHLLVSASSLHTE